nr:DUF664 domain-containing protein [Micromonospora musae]
MRHRRSSYSSRQFGPGRLIWRQPTSDPWPRRQPRRPQRFGRPPSSTHRPDFQHHAIPLLRHGKLRQRTAHRHAGSAIRQAGCRRGRLPNLCAAPLAGELASHLRRLHRRMRDTDKAIEAAFSDQPQPGIIRSLPGRRALVAAEFIVAVGDLSTFVSPDHLAEYAGLAPVSFTWPDGRTPSVRAMLLDMIEEYARHTGHADILREAVDGRVGEGAPEDFTF